MQKPDLLTIAELYKRLGSASSLGEYYGKSDRWGRRWVEKAKKEGIITSSVAEPIMRTVSYKDIMTALREHTEVVSKIEPRKPSKIGGESLCILLTDFHIGSTVKDEDGNYIYNISIAKKRAEELMSNILTLAKQHITKSTKLSHIAVMIGGDIVDGEGIYEGQSFQLEEVPPKQVLVAYQVISGLLKGLLTLKVPVDVYCCPGNHGRVSYESSPQSNWDLMLYYILKEFNIDKNIEIHLSEKDYINFEIQGWKYHLRHKWIGQVETAAGRAKVSGWASIHDADAIVCGHLHHISIAENLGQLNIMGGSLKGSDDFSESLAKGSEPCQLVWGCTKKHLISFVYPVRITND